MQFIEHLLRLFREERPLLEARGTLIVRQLCELLEPRQASRTQWRPIGRFCSIQIIEPRQASSCHARR